MRSKYEPLKAHLRSLKGDNWSPHFHEIEMILGFPLPLSAHKHPAWWANELSGSHSHASSWIDVGWNTREPNLESKRVTFCRNAQTLQQQPILAVKLVPKPSRERDEPSKHEWGIASEVSCELRLCWTQIGKVNLEGERLVFPFEVPDVAGLYRMSIRKESGSESCYVGETTNLPRRFYQYSNPGPSQATNLRMNDYLRASLRDKAQIVVAIVTEDAWIVRNGERQPADLTSKSVRRMFEHFVQVIEGDTTIESLNR